MKMKKTSTATCAVLLLGLLAGCSESCDDQVVAAFEQVPPPPGIPVDTFVGAEGCMAETPARTAPTTVFDHYRAAFSERDWRIITDNRGALRAEKDDVYIYVYNAEGRVYFILGQL
jgi:hypothetical protein